jgi:hypothetical protein
MGAPFGATVKARRIMCSEARSATGEVRGYVVPSWLFRFTFAPSRYPSSRRSSNARSPRFRSVAMAT